MKDSSSFVGATVALVIVVYMVMLVQVAMDLQKDKLEQAHQLELITTQQKYQDISQRQECLHRTLEWAGEYVRTLDIPRIEMVKQECYEREK